MSSNRQIRVSLWSILSQLWAMFVVFLSLSSVASSQRTSEKSLSVNPDSLLVPNYTRQYATGLGLTDWMLANNPSDSEVIGLCLTGYHSLTPMTQTVFLNASTGQLIGGPFVNSQKAREAEAFGIVSLGNLTVSVYVKASDYDVKNIYAQAYRELMPAGSPRQLTNYTLHDTRNRHVELGPYIAVDSSRQTLFVNWVIERQPHIGPNFRQVILQAFDSDVRPQAQPEILVNETATDLYTGKVANSGSGKVMTVFFHKENVRTLKAQGVVTEMPAKQVADFSLSGNVSAFRGRQGVDLFDLQTVDNNHAAVLMAPDSSVSKDNVEVNYIPIGFDGNVGQPINLAESIQFEDPDVHIRDLSLLVLQRDHFPLRKGDAITAFADGWNNQLYIFALRGHRIFGTLTQLAGVNFGEEARLNEIGDCIMLSWGPTTYFDGNITFTCLKPREPQPKPAISVASESGESTTRSADAAVIVTGLVAATLTGLAAYSFFRARKTLPDQNRLLINDADDRGASCFSCLPRFFSS